MSAARHPTPLDPEAEYEAAKAQFIKAMARMTAAKAVMKPIWEAQYQAKKQAQRAVLLAAAEAHAAGASKQEVLQIGGKNPKYASIHSLLWGLWREWVPDDEYYDEAYYERHEPTWERRMSERALFHYRERAKP